MVNSNLPASFSEVKVCSQCEAAAREIMDRVRLYSKGKHPLFLLLYYETTEARDDLVSAVKAHCEQEGIAAAVTDFRRDPALPWTSVYYSGGDPVFNIIADIPRSEPDGEMVSDFLTYLNFHRDAMVGKPIRFLLCLPHNEARAFMNIAGDLWDFRNTTIWLEPQE